MVSFKELWSILKEKKILLLASLILVIILASTGPFSLFAQAYFIDTIESLVENKFEIEKIVLPALFLFLSFILPNAKLVYDYLNSKLNFAIGIRWTKKINTIISQIPYWHYENEDTHDKIKQVNENNLYGSIISCFFSLMTLIISVIMFSIVLFNVSIWLVISVMLFAPFIGYVSLKIADTQYQKIRKLNPDRRRGLYKSSVLREREFAKEIRMNNSNKYMLDDWLHLQKNIDSKVFKTQFKYGFYGALIQKTEFVVILINLIIVLISYLNGHISVGFFISLSNQIFTMRLLSKVQNVASQFGVAKSVRNSCNDVALLLATDNDGNLINDSAITIEFKNVFYKYPNADEYILENISLLIQQGESIAIVGENGAGKSTLIKLLLGLYEPTEGEILINGVNACSLNPMHKAKLFGVAFQDFAKFALSLKDTISFDDEESDILEIAKQFDIDSIAKKYDTGYDTILGKSYGEAVDISGGQWQSIAIVRALCGKTKNIFIFDEPTASLDPIKEVETFKKISTLTKNKTTIYITHRLGFTNKVTRILLIKNNTLFEEGSFDDLIKLRGEFYTLYNEQKNLYIR